MGLNAATEYCLSGSRHVRMFSRDESHHYMLRLLKGARTKKTTQVLMNKHLCSLKLLL